jgi:hypothetical protein
VRPKAADADGTMLGVPALIVPVTVLVAADAGAAITAAAAIPASRM